MTIDAGRKADWGLTSRDYATYRPGPPDGFYDRLEVANVGGSGQSLLDLGTGTGLLACEMARRGANVCGTDISKGQIDAAGDMATKAGLDIDFQASPSHIIPYADASFDAVTALQCWWYFDEVQTLREIARVLKSGGRLAIAEFSFLPRDDAIVRASERLVLKYNPDWSGAHWDGSITLEPKRDHSDFRFEGMFCFDSDIPFTREAWRGRMRALRGMSASLPPEEVATFDAEHDKMLAGMAGERFTIRHRTHAHIYKFIA